MSSLITPARVTGPRTLILHEPHDGELAAILKVRLSAESAGFDPGGDVVDGRIVAILPSSPGPSVDDRRRLERMVDRLRTVGSRSRSAGVLVIVQFGGGRFGSSADVDPESCGAAGFARSIHLERPRQRVRVVDLDRSITADDAALRIAEALNGESKFEAIGFDAENRRIVARANVRPIAQAPDDSTTTSWTSEDVILITGGARGITAECALALGRTTGARLVLVGSSPAPREGEAGDLAATLARFREAGVSYRYETCDVTDAPAVAALVDRVRSSIGPITGVVHAAGVNRPRRVEQVDHDEAMAQAAVKLIGLANLERALEDSPPRRLVAFTSIIGVTGMPGNSWYGFANEQLDLAVRRYSARRPATSTLSIAFSVWGETGMGARLGSVEQLGRLGIGAIPTAEGVRRFLSLFLGDAVGQVVVTGRLGGLDTWPTDPASLTDPGRFRFLERVVRRTPGVELIARARLSIDRDSYVRDHIYNGSYLFPTVFGLEAMAQAAATVLGDPRPKVARIEDVTLERPIVVDPSQGTEIEIRAEAAEPGLDGNTAVRVEIRTESTGFAIDHFAATIVIGRQSVEPPAVAVPDGSPLAIDPMTDLYGGLLFQGASFQRMGPIHELDSDHAIFESTVAVDKESSRTAFPIDGDRSILLGDPFFRDVLLQAGQLTIPRELCLPVGIERIERFEPSVNSDRRRFVFAPSKVRQGNEYLAEIFATDAHGRMTERLTGYRLRILEDRPDNPSAEDLANPGPRDERIVHEALERGLAAVGRSASSPCLDSLPGLHRSPSDERHRRESSLIARSIGDRFSGQREVARDQNGRPRIQIDGSPSNVGISLSHDDRNAICLVGEGPQGCDLEPIRGRSADDWRTILGDDRWPLLETLVRDGDSIDLAGARAWSAIESLRKATESPVIHLEPEARSDRAVLFRASNLPGSPSVITVPVRLTFGPERMIAITTSTERMVQELPMDTPSVTGIDPETHRVRVADDGPQGQPVQELRFSASFRDASGISRRIPAPRYLEWMGKMRELVTSRNVPGLVDRIASGRWGLVTNWADVRIVGEATANDVIQMRFWTDAPRGSEVEYTCDFARVLSDGRMERLAIGTQKATWVRLVGHGLVRPEPLPDDLADFVAKMGPRPGFEGPGRPSLPEPMAGLNVGPVIHRSASGPPRGRPLSSETFQTTLEEANLVGNVYFANYFAWQNRVRDLFLHRADPGIHRGIGERGECVTLHSRVDYLREAMPFDRIQVDLRISTLTRSGATLAFENYRIGSDGSRQKLSIGTQDVAWVRRSAAGVPNAEPWPDAVRRALAPNPVASRIVLAQ